MKLEYLYSGLVQLVYPQYPGILQTLQIDGIIITSSMRDDLDLVARF